MAVVVYIYLQKVRPELIAGTTDFKVMIEMGEVGTEVLSTEG